MTDPLRGLRIVVAAALVLAMAGCSPGTGASASAADRLIEAPDDLAAWFEKQRGITPIAAVRTVQVGGLDATQLDFRNTAPIRFGPFPGIGDPRQDPSQPYFGFGEPGNTFRLIVLRGAGQHVVFRMWVDLCCSSPDTASRQFAPSMAALQQVMDSITWGPTP